MTANLHLKADASRFSPIPPQTITLAYIACQKQPMSLASIQKNLKKLVPGDAVDAAVSRMIESGDVSLDKSVGLTAQGRDRAKSELGADAGAKWEGLRNKRLPLLALGLDPDSSDVRRRFASAEALKSGSIAVAFGLPRDAMQSMKVVTSELVWKLLRAGMADVIGTGPFPVIEKPGVTERTLLAGFAGVRAKAMPEAINGIAALALGIEKVSAEALRERLIQVGVSRAATTVDRLPAAPKSPSIANGAGTFAQQVLGIAADLSTPPFQGRVAIAQVYDAYGKVHADAGSLQSFKERLVQSAREREIDLGRLDMPERMSKELRQRSETTWGSDAVHFVITEWK